MSRAQVVSRDEWGGDKATAAISAWRSAEEQKADRLLRQDAWLAQEALLRGDIDRYTGITGITPQVYNPNFEEVKSEIEKAGRDIQGQYQKDQESVLGSVRSDLDSRLSTGEDLDLLKKVGKEGYDKVLQQYFQRQWEPVEKKYQSAMSSLNKEASNNQEFIQGREFGKAYNNLIQGYLYDKKKGMSEDQLFLKYGPIVDSAATSWAREGNYIGMFAPAKKGDGGGRIQQFTMSMKGSPVSHSIEGWPGMTDKEMAAEIKRRYTRYRDWSVEDIVANMGHITPGAIIQDTKRGEMNATDTSYDEYRRERGARRYGMNPATDNTGKATPDDYRRRQPGGGPILPAAR